MNQATRTAPAKRPTDAPELGARFGVAWIHSLAPMLPRPATNVHLFHGRCAASRF